MLNLMFYLSIANVVILALMLGVLKEISKKLDRQNS